MVPTQMDYVQIISNASLMVKFVLLLLLFFSVMSWAIIIIKMRYIRKAFKESDIFIDYFWKSRDLAGAFTKAKQLRGSPVARIFRIGYTELRKLNPGGKPGDEPASDERTPSLRHGISGTDNVKRALRRAINTEMTRVTQMVPFSGNHRQHHPIYRPVRHRVGHHELLPRHRAAGFCQSRRRGPGYFGSPGGHGRRPGGGHSRRDRIQPFHAENTGDRDRTAQFLG
jgi:hypothetical protein